MAVDKSAWTVGHLLARQGQARPDAPFLQVQDGAPVTYGEADRTANRFARGIAQLGIGPGERVGVMLPNGLEILYAWFGLCRAGAVSVFINTAYKGIFLEHVLNNAETGTAIFHVEYLAVLAESLRALPKLKRVIVVGDPLGGAQSPLLPGVELLPWGDVLDAFDAPVDIPVSYRDIGSIMYTSGTTGPSKGVLMPHAHLYLFGMRSRTFCG